jgi:hypothetical protein
MHHLSLIVAITIAAAGAAHAEPADSPARTQIARRLYDEGVEAANKSRFAVALDRFKASYELAPRVQTLYNLAFTQGQTGRLVEAAESYRRFLRETADGRFAELRAVATEQVDQLDKQIPQATLEVPGLEPTDTLAVDDLELPHGALREALPMNPGPHVARVQRGTQVLATRAFTLSAGATEQIRIDLPMPVDLQLRPPAEAPRAAAPVPPAPHPVDHGHAWLRSPWLWSAVAVVAVGTATGAYLLTRPDGTVIH